MIVASLYKRIGRLIYQNPIKVILISGLLALAGGFYTTKIAIRADLKDLLPPHFESIRNLTELEDKYGGLGYLMLGVEVRDPEDAKNFLKDLVPEILKIPNVRFVSYRRPLQFFLQNLPLYLDLDDLKEIERRLRVKQEEMKKGASPLFEGFLSFNENDLNFEDIIASYEKREVSTGPLTEYYQNDEGTFFAVLIKPAFSHKNLEESQVLISSVEEAVRKTTPQKYGQGVQVSLGGEYKTNLDEEQHLRDEIGRTSGIVLILLMLVLVVYYRRLSTIPLIGIPLLAGILWTGGLFYFFLGHVNLVTGFSAMILAGLGSDYGIYLLTRFFQEIERGNSPKQSYRHAFALTSRATRGSAMTTIIAFGALWCSSFRGFSELGLIGVIGILMNLLAMHTVLPALIVLLNQKGIFRWERRFFPWSPQLRLKQRWLSLSLPIFAFFVVAFFAAGSQTPKVSYIEYDLNKLETSHLPSEQTDQRVSGLFKNSLRPAVVIVEGGEEKERRVLELLDLRKNEAPALAMIKGGLGLASFVPVDQAIKKPAIARIQALLRRMKLTLIGPSRTMVNRFLSFQSDQKITRDNLPPEIVQLFSPSKISGAVPQNTFVYIFPESPLVNTEKLCTFVSQLKELSRDFGQGVKVVSDSFITVDILNLLERESPRALLLIFALCFLYLLLEYHSPKTALLLTGMIFVALILFFGGMVLWNLRFNFFNLAAVAVILGTGFDSFIHLTRRFQENRGNVLEAVNQMAPSIVVANLTTTIGFGGFLLTDNAGLRSLGWLVVLGMTLVTLTVLLFLPACWTLTQQLRQQPKVKV